MAANELIPWINSAGEGGARNSMQEYPGTGTNGPFEFNFAGGYIDQSHVKAYRYDPVPALTYSQTLTFVGPNQVTTSDVIPPGQFLVLYRDTPKDKPLVDYSEGAVMDEASLDKSNNQAVFISAEMLDRFDAVNVTSAEAIQRSLLAYNRSNTAVQTANDAVLTASAANEMAENATSVANIATSLANSACLTANGIDAKAQKALITSDSAEKAANVAKVTAEGIDEKVQSAVNTAALANAKADEALDATTGKFSDDITVRVESGEEGGLNISDELDRYRWHLHKTYDEESGNNEGSDFEVARCDDDGIWIDSPLVIKRSTGVMSLTQRPLFNDAVPWDSANFDPSPFTGRNKIINGAMQIAQRASYLVVSAYPFPCSTVDRFRLVLGTGEGRFEQAADAPVGFSYSAKVTINTGGELENRSVNCLWQGIEGCNVVDLAYGNANAKQATLSFWVKASIPGQYAVGLRDAAFCRSCVIPYNISKADAWEYKTVTFPGDTAWEEWTDRDIYIVWDLGSGSHYNSKIAKTWTFSQSCRFENSVGLAQNSGATFQITGVQFESGAVATPFEWRHIATEQRLCERYYEVVNCTASFVNTTTGLLPWTAYRYRTLKRSQPTLTYDFSGESTGAKFYAFNSNDTDTFTVAVQLDDVSASYWMTVYSDAEMQ